jgi:hypothetical protein
MPKLRDDAGVPYPQYLATYDRRLWECERDWKFARARWARDNGYPYKRLPLVQRSSRDVWIARYRQEGLTNPEWDGVERTGGDDDE